MIESWFLFSILSAIAAGAAGFLLKIASQEDIDIVVLSFFTSIITSLIVVVCIFIFSDFSSFWHPMLIFAFLTSSTYLTTSVTKVKSLENIDSAIFFPLYKVLGPLLAIIAGIILFQERFSTYETLGLLLSLSVPLMLITRSEEKRQINLKKGLLFLLLTSIIGSISAVTWKYGSNIAPNAWTYILAGEIFVFISSTLSLLKTHKKNTRQALNIVNNPLFLKMLIVYSMASFVAASSVVFAFTNGGPLGIVYTINSLYILIPIILSIIFYGEHWNVRKVIAIILSVVALAFFG